VRPFVFFLVLLSIPCSCPAQSAPLVLDRLGRMTQPVDGLWQFQTGDNLAWASPALDDSRWQPVPVGQSWESQGHRNYTGFAWYRRHLVLPPGTPANLNLALFLPAVQNAAEVYWNGKLIGSYGKLPPNPVWYLGRSPHAFPLGPAHSGILAIRVWSAPILYLSDPEQGGLSSTPQLGTAQGVAALETSSRYRDLLSNQCDLAVALVSALIGLLAFCSWLRDRSRSMLFWLAFPMLRPVALAIIEFPSFATFRLFYASIGEIVAITGAATWFLLLYLLDLHGNRTLVRWTKRLAVFQIGLTMVDTVMVLPDWTRLFPHQFLSFDIASTIPVELLELYVLVIVAFALRKRLDTARWMLAIASVLAALVQAAADSGLGRRWTHWTFGSQVFRPLFTLAGSPFSASTLVNLFLLVSLLYAAWRYSVERNQRQNAIEQEFLSAQEIQKILIPEVLPAIAGYSVSSAYYPAQQVGGDFFQIIPLALQPGTTESRQVPSAIIVLGDVSGKGLKAAMTVSLLVGAIRSTVERTQNPAEILAALNRRLFGRMQSGFATCLVLHLDAAGSGTLANAGHLPPFLNGTEFPLAPALPLGLLPEAAYETTALTLAAGDRLTLYTDGLLEARNPAGELFGFARIAQITGNTSEQIARTAQDFGQDDDITVLTLTRLPPANALG
jgi:hypothetical protein